LFDSHLQRKIPAHPSPAFARASEPGLTGSTKSESSRSMFKPKISNWIFWSLMPIVNPNV
jgi:hypothetical protein